MIPSESRQNPDLENDRACRQGEPARSERHNRMTLQPVGFATHDRNSFAVLVGDSDQIMRITHDSL
jgi:hypothetical protein